MHQPGSFRRAASNDWHRIWPVFSEVVASGDTYMFPPDISEADARAAWLLVDQQRAATFCAEIDGQVVGTAIVKPNATGLGDHVANGAWMVSASARGRGVGRRFAEYVIDHARAAGYMGMQFNAVVSTNANAIALWKSLGFSIVGTVPGAFRHAVHGRVPIHIMYREL